MTVAALALSVLSCVVALNLQRCLRELARLQERAMSQQIDVIALCQKEAIRLSAVSDVLTDVVAYLNRTQPNWEVPDASDD